MQAAVDITSSSIQTKRLILRPFNKEDLLDLHYIFSKEGGTESYGLPPHTSIEQSEELLKKFIKGKNVFALVLKETNKVIGNIGLGKLIPSIKQINDTELQGVNVDFLISKDYWNQGLATEALKAIISHSFFSRHLDFLVCGHFEENLSSKRVIEKCGFKFYTNGKFKEHNTANYILFNYYKRNNCHCELCLTSTTCLCKLCPNHDFCLINKPVSCKFKAN